MPASTPSRGGDGVLSAAPAAGYLQAAVTGRLLAEQHLQVVYGGGRLGLMGTLADAVLDAGGHITGILPAFLNAVPGVAHRGLTELRIVPDMATRKAELTAADDAFLALPGGRTTGCGGVQSVMEP
jgi:uncharacterized protein (TIGR00730 family)